ncbi:hypothetical protein CYMTET_13821 [Cymbomonas tetramitiformis]|uniref:Uncharacterized protein n=1 Tax=Cymbomonas tetramitiformis TaxID=36881 RepID=A0AAE0GHM0_9CHLO|nr:hypothetical protein CYMTET_13821 [Cymbomonas tetramitiformis]
MDEARALLSEEGGYTTAHHEVAKELLTIVVGHLERVSTWEETCKDVGTFISGVRSMEAWTVTDARCVLLMFLYLCGFTSSSHGRALLRVHKFDVLIQQGIRVAFSVEGM